MGDLEHGQLTANGITMHYVTVGAGPLVVFCHGFPESWYSWRHQLPAVADAGFRAVALDMRGYGGTDKPAEVSAYSLGYVIGDVVGAVAALEEHEAVIVGHDFGALAAWYAALLRPDVFRAVAALSVPYSGPIGGLPEGLTLLELTRRPGSDFYRQYFQPPGVAEAELEKDVSRWIRGFLYTISGDIISDGVHTEGWDGYFPEGEPLTDQLVDPATSPPWLTDDDLAFYVGEFERNGFRGPINWYRNLNALPALLAPFVGATIRQPAFYLGGEHDRIAGNTPKALARMQASLPDLRCLEVLPGAGHWLQQERKDEVNAKLVEFLRSVR